MLALSASRCFDPDAVYAPLTPTYPGVRTHIQLLELLTLTNPLAGVSQHRVTRSQ